MQNLETIKTKIEDFKKSEHQALGLNRASWMLCAELVHLAEEPMTFDLPKAQAIVLKVLESECNYLAQNFMSEQITEQVLPEIRNAISRMVDESPLIQCPSDEAEITRMLGFLDRFVGQAAMNAEDRIIDLLPVMWMLGLIRETQAEVA